MAVNGSRFRKQEGTTDEVYVLGINGETEAVFDINGTAKFFNINASNEIIGRFIPGAPTDLYLSNTTLSGTYEATNSITVEDNVTVSGPTTLKAGNNIHLKPGFHAPSGIDFTAKIGSVTNTIKRYYYLKDHLGSIRVVVDETGNIVSSDDYDPWGMILNGRSTDGSYLNAKYKFTSKERDVETGYDYFGTRYYDGRIGRWLQVDPLAEKYFGWSPYNYVQNNPLISFDPDGRYKVHYQGRFFSRVSSSTTSMIAAMDISLSSAFKFVPSGLTTLAAKWMRNDPSWAITQADIGAAAFGLTTKSMGKLIESGFDANSKGTVEAIWGATDFSLNAMLAAGLSVTGTERENYNAQTIDYAIFVIGQASGLGTINIANTEIFNVASGLKMQNVAGEFEGIKSYIDNYLNAIGKQAVELNKEEWINLSKEYLKLREE